MDISIAKRRAKNAHNSNGSKKKRKKKTAHINNRLNRFTQTLLVYLITISTHTHTCSTTIISFLSINILASRRRNFFSIRMCNTHFEYGAKKFCFVCVFISLIYNYIDDDDTTSTTLKIRWMKNIWHGSRTDRIGSVASHRITEWMPMLWKEF